MLGRRRLCTWPAGAGHADVVQLLLQSKCNMSLQDGERKTALHMAILGAHTKVVDLLLRHNCDTQLYYKYEESSALYMASERGQPAEVKLLLKYKPGDANLHNWNGQTALHPAAESGHAEVVKLLLESNCEVNLQDKSRATALHLASQGAHTNVVRLLLDRNADVDVKDSDQRTALHRVSSHGKSADIVKLLVEKGASFQTEDTFGRTPLYLNSMHGQMEAIEFLISRGATFTRKHFSLALKNHNTDVLGNIMGHVEFQEWIRMTVDDSSDPELRFQYFKDKISLEKLISLLEGEDKQSIFGLACKNNLVDIVKYLAEKCNADINRGSPTPFWYAVDGGHEKVVGFLCQLKERLYFQRKAPDGTSPLMMAITKEHSHLLAYFEELLGNDVFQIMSNCIKFGRPKLISSKLREKIKLTHDQLLELMKDAVRSDCADTLRYVTLLTEDSQVDLNSLKSDVKHIVDARHSLEIKASHERHNEFQVSPLVELSNVYPIFNESIEHKWAEQWQNENVAKLSHSSDKYVDMVTDIGNKILEPFCCINDLESATSRNAIGSMKMLVCQTNCKQVKECQRIKDLLSACQQMEKNMQEDPEMTFLKPQLFLIGSIAEGTRMGKATELDVTMKFDGLEESPFRLGRNATELLLPDQGPARSYFHKFCKEGTEDIFDFPRFLKFLLETLEACLSKVDLKKLGLGVVRWNKAYKPCKKCFDLSHKEAKSIHKAAMHCKTCSPVVTMTKIGPCLVFRRMESLQEFFVTIDLVPVFYVSEPDNLKLLNSAIETLVDNRPPFWLDYFKNLMSRDTILPDAFTSDKKSPNDDESATEKQYIAIKLLHYGPEPNYMIRPGQEMEIEHFHSNPILKQVYIRLKAIKDILNVNIKSYKLKKVVLLPQFITETKSGSGNVLQHLFSALSHPELRKPFEWRIDFGTWSKRPLEPQNPDDLRIPLLR